MARYSVYPLIIALFTFLQFGCEKKKKEDPCDNSSNKPAIADFSMGVYSYNACADGGFYHTHDSIEYGLDTFWDRNIYFKVLTNDYDSIRWIIGNPLNTFSEKEFKLSFVDVPVGETIPVTLRVYKEALDSCYPEDDGWDEITKNLSFEDFPTIEQAFGDFFGSIEGSNPLDTFTLKLFDGIHEPGSELLHRLVISNFNNEFSDNILTMNSTFRKHGVYFCTGMGGNPAGFEANKLRQQFGKLIYSNNYNTITLEYYEAIDPHLTNMGNNSRFRRFVGQRVE